MISRELAHARNYEQNAGAECPGEGRPVFHLSPRTGWMNDPNGFSFHNGEYHLFYQYHPYSSVWGPMHWGHAVSRDLLDWRHLPAALAPDEAYDAFGCFSGSAISLPDGRQLLLYTGVRRENGEEVQNQCVAVGDGRDFEKPAFNPVLDGGDIPADMCERDFRDPKIWREPDGTYRCVAGACGRERKGRILLFSSPDAFKWKFESVLAQNDGRWGTMWECPDFFPLDGQYVLLASPQDMLPDGREYHCGSGTICLTGGLDGDKKHFTPVHDQSVDQGVDFYAPQTVLTPDGRRVMIGWMQNWDTCALTGAGERPWFGQMSIPRELTIRDGWLYQQPVRELERYRRGRTAYENVPVQGRVTLEGIEGRVVELELTIRPEDPQKLYQKFTVHVAEDGRYHTAVRFRPRESMVELDRRFSGSRKACLHQCSAEAPGEKGELKLRVILDRFSAEVFVNDGRRVLTAVIWTDPAAKGISFYADGAARMDVTKYDLVKGENAVEGF